MNMEKFTQKARAIISSAQGIAASQDNQQVMPIHLLQSLLDSEDKIAANIINSAGGNLPLIIEQAKAELSKLPKVQVSGGSQVYFSSEAIKLLERATSLAKAAGDSFV